MTFFYAIFAGVWVYARLTTKQWTSSPQAMQDAITAAEAALEETKDTGRRLILGTVETDGTSLALANGLVKRLEACIITQACQTQRDDLRNRLIKDVEEDIPLRHGRTHLLNYVQVYFHATDNLRGLKKLAFSPTLEGKLKAARDRRKPSFASDKFWIAMEQDLISNPPWQWYLVTSTYRALFLIFQKDVKFRLAEKDKTIAEMRRLEQVHYFRFAHLLQ